MKRDRVTTALLSLFLGSVGVHFLYIGKYKLARNRFLLFFVCNPICFVKSWQEAYRIAKMTDYEFNNTYLIERVQETGTRIGLHDHINKLNKK